MVLCLIALPIFAILGIFSVKHRKLTAEAFECLFKTITLRKCRSGLDDRIKSGITGRLLKFSPKTAGFAYRHYKTISWIILIIFLWSIYVSSIGIYNYANYGNCNGPAEVGLCLLDPTGQNSKISEVDVDTQTTILYPKLEKEDPTIGNPDAKLTIIEFGCYACPYTKKAEPIIQEVLDYYNGEVNLQFKTFYIPHHPFSYKSALASNCAIEQNAYREFHRLAFEMQENMSDLFFSDMANDLGLNAAQFDDCLNNEKYKAEVNEDTLAGIHAGVRGTPTFFVNHQKIVGPKPFRTFRNIINEELGR